MSSSCYEDVLHKMTQKIRKTAKPKNLCFLQDASSSSGQVQVGERPGTQDWNRKLKLPRNNKSAQLRFKIKTANLTVKFKALTNKKLVKPSGSSVHGILTARILEWVAIPISRGYSQPRDQTRISHTAGRLSHKGSPQIPVTSGKLFSINN